MRFLITIFMFLFTLSFIEISMAQTQGVLPSPAAAIVVPASVGFIGWISQNWGMIASALLLVSEGLAMVFPASSGFGGILAGIIKFVKSLNIQPPPSGS